MGTYIIRRVLQMIPVLIGATFLIFVMVFALPGDPTDGKCGERPCSPAYIAEFKKEYNLNDNVFLRYAKYTGIWPTEQGGLLQGNLGKNYNGYKVVTKPAKELVTICMPVGTPSLRMSGDKLGE